MGLDSFVASEVRDFLGGIDMSWKSENVEIEVIEKHFKFLHVKLKLQSGEECLFTPLYASSREEGVSMKCNLRGGELT